MSWPTNLIFDTHVHLYDIIGHCQVQPKCHGVKVNRSQKQTNCLQEYKNGLSRQIYSKT